MSNSLQRDPASQVPPVERAKCVVLVPVAGSIDFQCESALRRLEELG